MLFRLGKRIKSLLSLGYGPNCGERKGYVSTYVVFSSAMDTTITPVRSLRVSSELVKHALHCRVQAEASLGSGAGSPSLLQTSTHRAGCTFHHH